MGLEGGGVKGAKYLVMEDFFDFGWWTQCHI